MKHLVSRRMAGKLAIVGGATLLVVNNEVFGANKYARQVINNLRNSLPETAEAFDKIPSTSEINNCAIDTWNSGVHKTFHWLADAPSTTKNGLITVYNKVKDLF
ncbi:unnamed protein product [Didymodactylos carnosus]|uniref:MICOS complex subunit MIC13 n=1 Tax=Didymodactylos carnosus TaxID=1234261 RepID=A0A814JGT2_9BILA|nr:unnamed protein product [Didymodactylos carnosus]CAF3806288.1 unnamed protein product [Didymodactylos carnosus]